METLHSRRTYDYRIQEAICETGDRDLFPELNIPRSTIQSWIQRGTTDLVSCDLTDDDRGELVAEIEGLRRRTAGWRRPRIRVYPAKPKVGIRPKAPGELLHLDVTIIRLLDGTRAYLHAVIENYSKRILSWTLEKRLGSGGTCRILREGVVQLQNCPKQTIVVADSGSENVNGDVDNFLDGEEWTCVLAQVEITFSDSMIEAFWRSLKHSWLYLHTRDSFAGSSSPHRVLRHRPRWEEAKLSTNAAFGIPWTDSK